MFKIISSLAELRQPCSTTFPFRHPPSNMRTVISPPFFIALPQNSQGVPPASRATVTTTFICRGWRLAPPLCRVCFLTCMLLFSPSGTLLCTFVLLQCNLPCASVVILALSSQPPLPCYIAPEGAAYARLLMSAYLRLLGPLVWPAGVSLGSGKLRLLFPLSRAILGLEVPTCIHDYHTLRTHYMLCMSYLLCMSYYYFPTCPVGHVSPLPLLCYGIRVSPLVSLVFSV